METSCPWVASGDWFQQAAVLGTLMLGFAMLATSRGRQFVGELVDDEDKAPDSQGSTVKA